MTKIYLIKTLKNDKINDRINDKINDLDKQIIAILQNNKYITIPELAKELNKSEPTIHRHLSYLISLNRIERIGSRKNGFWKIINNN